MDNASKALIIAGAVLIAVMLVSVGVMIYQQAAGVINQGQNNMDALEVSMANQVYTQYVGAKKNRNTAAQLLEQAAQQIEANADHTVSVTFSGDHSMVIKGNSAASDGKLPNTNAKDMRDTANKIRTTPNWKYTISTHTDTNGYIDEIIIEPVK